MQVFDNDIFDGLMTKIQSLWTHSDDSGCRRHFLHKNWCFCAHNCSSDTEARIFGYASMNIMKNKSVPIQIRTESDFSGYLVAGYPRFDCTLYTKYPVLSSLYLFISLSLYLYLSIFLSLSFLSLPAYLDISLASTYR